MLKTYLYRKKNENWLKGIYNRK